MNITEIFNYDGNTVTFKNADGTVMVNAADMARPFGKVPKDYFRTDEAKAYCNILCLSNSLIISKRAESHLSNATDYAKAYPQLVITKQGSPANGGGVWIHEDLALEFARWLSPQFTIWCNDRIKELLKHGLTALNPEYLNDPDYVISLMEKLKTERTAKAQKGYTALGHTSFPEN